MLRHVDMYLPLPVCGERAGVRGGNLKQRWRKLPPLTLALPHAEEAWGEGTRRSAVIL